MVLSNETNAVLAVDADKDAAVINRDPVHLAIDCNLIVITIELKILHKIAVILYKDQRQNRSPLQDESCYAKRM